MGRSVRMLGGDKACEALYSPNPRPGPNRNSATVTPTQTVIIVKIAVTRSDVTDGV